MGPARVGSARAADLGYRFRQGVAPGQDPAGHAHHVEAELAEQEGGHRAAPAAAAVGDIAGGAVEFGGPLAQLGQGNQQGPGDVALVEFLVQAHVEGDVVVLDHGLGHRCLDLAHQGLGEQPGELLAGELEQDAIRQHPHRHRAGLAGEEALLPEGGPAFQLGGLHRDPLLVVDPPQLGAASGNDVESVRLLAHLDDLFPRHHRPLAEAGEGPLGVFQGNALEGGRIPYQPEVVVVGQAGLGEAAGYFLQGDEIVGEGGIDVAEVGVLQSHDRHRRG